MFRLLSVQLHFLCFTDAALVSKSSSKIDTRCQQRKKNPAKYSAKPGIEPDLVAAKTKQLPVYPFGYRVFNTEPYASTLNRLTQY